MHWRHCFFPLWPCRVNKQSLPIRDGGIWIGTCKKGWVIKFQYTHSKFPPKCYFISKFNSPTGSDQPGKGSFTSSKMSWLQTKCLFNILFTFFLSYLHLKSNLYGQSFAFSTQKSRALEWRRPDFSFNPYSFHSTRFRAHHLSRCPARHLFAQKQEAHHRNPCLSVIWIFSSILLPMVAINLTMT